MANQEKGIIFCIVDQAPYIMQTYGEQDEHKKRRSFYLKNQLNLCLIFGGGPGSEKLS